jgi:methyltransferase (TIGR00027 family)
MSTLRSPDDSWDIATSVGATAVMVAAARAAEAARDDRLIDDPYAEILVAGAGSGSWEYMLDGTFAAKIAEIDAEAAAMFEQIRTYQAVRTRFFDAFFADAATAGIRQIVILASGLDSRAYRLEWPADTTVFEIDQPKVLEYKTHTLAAHGAQPSADRREVGIDLRFDWPAGLRDNGFDTAKPTAWLAEGLLMYLPADAQDHLFERITELSAAGSRIAAEGVGTRAGTRRVQRRKRFEKIREQLGIGVNFDMSGLINDDLIYDDPNRSDVAGWLDEHGWQAVAVQSRQVQQQLGRHIELENADEDAYSKLITAELGVRG